MPTRDTKKTGRLKRRSDFLRVQGENRKWVSPTVIVQAGTGQADTPRCGFTATKKLGGAVTRNRAKRRMREAARVAMAGVEAPHDIVLIGRAETTTCPFAALVKDLKWCLKRLNVSGHAQAPDSAA